MQVSGLSIKNEVIMALSLALIIVFGLSADYLFSRIKLPGLIGMLIVGVFAGPYMLNIMSPGMMQVSGDLRKIALIVILLRAGFELRREALRRVGRAAVIMSAVRLFLRSSELCLWLLNCCI